MSSNKFLVGDIVRIRDWDDMCSEFPCCSDDCIDIDGIGFISEMRQYCGKVSKIKSLSPIMSPPECTIVRFENDTITGGGWTYTTSMIELVERPGSEMVSESEPDLLAILTTA